MRNRYLYCICLALILLWGLLICPIRDSYHSKGPPEDYAGQYIDALGVIDKLEPKSYGDYYIYLSSITFRDEGQKGDSAQINPPKGIVCIIQNSETFDSLKCGMQLEVRGKYALFDEPSNPGEFNLRNYYRSLGMEGKIKSPDIAVIKTKYPLQAICYDLKRNLKDRIEAMYEGYTEGIMTALLVGDKENLPEEVKDSFKASGVSHILAISSANTQLASYPFSQSAAFPRAPDYHQPDISILPLWSYPREALNCLAEGSMVWRK